MAWCSARQKAAESVIEAFIQTNNNILVQEYIREANGADIRCLVVNGKVVAAMRRQAQPGSFAPTCTVAVPPRRSRSPRKSAPPRCRPPRSWGWMWRGRYPAQRPWPAGAGGQLLPGLQGVEAASGKDVAGKIIEFLELKASRKNKPAE